MKLSATPQNPKDRFEVYRFFNGLSAEGKESFAQGQSRVPMVKSFLLEHVSSHSGRVPKKPTDIFKGLGADVIPIDEAFFGIRLPVKESKEGDAKPTVIGFVEPYDERFFAYYTVESSADVRQRVTRWVTRSPDLDSTWFSSQLLQTLWDRDVSLRGDHRYVKLVFKHESLFEMPENAETAVESDEESETESEAEENDDSPEIERRKTRSELGDRIERIRHSLASLQKSYDPFAALFSLWFPSHAARGSHVLFQQGQITNRTDSFEDHRNTVRYLYRTYKAVLEATERSAHSDMEKPPRALSFKVGIKGVPLIVRFEEPLAEQTFKRWISLAFQKKNRFRLWGNPIWLGPTKVHVYGADRHLWQPINLELTAGGMTAILPQGTCGNTFHRLVTNIQRYVSPKVDVWLGAQRFDDLLGPDLASLKAKDET
jgi:hypothetical protein